MRHHRRFPVLALSLLLGILVAPTSGEGQTPDDWSFSGGFQLGFRSIDLDGREEKYKEDLNLENGPRLFHFEFDLAPPAELRRYFDHLEIDLSNLGGDPFESLRFTVEKYGRYALKWEQRKSAYFYENLLLSPDFTARSDHHTFDFDRVRDSASLELWLGNKARVDVGFDRFTKKGRSTTTYNIQRDEFEFERPIDESLNEYRAGLTYDWQRVTLVLREHHRKYENSVEAILPGASEGLTPDDATSLDFFFLEEPYDLSTHGHSAALVARPNERTMIQLEAAREDFDLTVDVSERSQGVDFLGEPFTTDVIGAAEIDRSLTLLDLSFSYRLTDRMAVVLEAKDKSLDQRGALDLDGGLDETTYKIDTKSGEAAVQFEASSKVTLSAGARSESRDAQTEASDPDRETDQSGYFALVGWRPGRRISVSARFDASSFESPLATASAGDRKSLRLRGRYAQPMGLSLSGIYHRDSVDNADSGWQATIEHLGLRAGYRFSLLSLSAGYTLVNSDREIDQTIVTLPGFLGGLELFVPIAYRADAEVIDARWSWAVNPRLKLGGEVRFYDNAGSFSVKREQARLFLEIGFGKGYVAHVGVRRVDFDEGRANFNDYQANIAELSLGYRWR